MEHSDPAVIQRRRLRGALRRLRNEKGLKQTQVAKTLEWSHSKIVRIESGEVGISPTDLRALLAVYEVTDPAVVEELLDLARGSRRRNSYADVLTSDAAQYIDYERSASTIHQFELSLIPGLVQTTDYADTLFRALNPDEDDERIARRLDARLERQRLLEDPNRPKIEYILSENAIRHIPLPVREGQLERLRKVGAENGISIQILSADKGLHTGLLGAFTILEFSGEDPDLLYFETLTGDTSTREKPQETGKFLSLFLELQERASEPDELNTVLARITF